MNEPKLGSIIEGDAERDAVHVAIAPVVAGHILYPGQAVGLGERDIVSAHVVPPVGIVDPYLTSKVMAGDRFWLFLYPRTITSLRHNWSHPTFDAAKKAVIEVNALELFVNRSGCNINALMERLDAYAENSCGPDDTIQETLNQLSDIERQALWAAYEKKRDIVVDSSVKAGDYFRCDC